MRLTLKAESKLQRGYTPDWIRISFPDPNRQILSHQGDLTFRPLVWYSIFMATMVKEFNTPTCDVGMRRCKSDWSPYDYADVVELADTPGLGPGVIVT